MPLTRPIPAEAMPVVEILRRDVKRPEGKASREKLGICLGYPADWRPEKWDFQSSFQGYACPLGLHPKSQSWLPGSIKTSRIFPLEREHVSEFIDWWHEQRDGEAATDAIWPVAS